MGDFFMDIYVTYQKDVISDPIKFTKIQDRFARKIKKSVNRNLPEVNKCFAVWYQFEQRNRGPNVMIFDSLWDRRTTDYVAKELCRITQDIADEVEKEYA